MVKFADGLLKIVDGHCVGRIAAFYTEESFKQYEQPTGGIGFFDSINDKASCFFIV